MSHRIGVVGFSAQDFDKVDAAAKMFSALRARSWLYAPDTCTVVSGYTNLGIPAIAYQCAKALGMPTVGIACEKANEYERFPCDEVVIVGTNWGDESSTFLASIDELIKVGGGKQSAAEYEAFKGPKEELFLG